MKLKNDGNGNKLFSQFKDVLKKLNIQKDLLLQRIFKDDADLPDAETGEEKKELEIPEEPAAKDKPRRRKSRKAKADKGLDLSNEAKEEDNLWPSFQEDDDDPVTDGSEDQGYPVSGYPLEGYQDDQDSGYSEEDFVDEQNMGFGEPDDAYEELITVDDPTFSDDFTFSDEEKEPETLEEAEKPEQQSEKTALEKTIENVKLGFEKSRDKLLAFIKTTIAKKRENKDMVDINSLSMDTTEFEMEKIYSTTEKKDKAVRQNPLEIDDDIVLVKKEGEISQDDEIVVSEKLEKPKDSEIFVPDDMDEAQTIEIFVPESIKDEPEQGAEEVRIYTPAEKKSQKRKKSDKKPEDLTTEPKAETEEPEDQESPAEEGLADKADVVNKVKVLVESIVQVGKAEKKSRKAKKAEKKARLLAERRQKAEEELFDAESALEEELKQELKEETKEEKTKEKDGEKPEKKRVGVPNYTVSGAKIPEYVSSAELETIEKVTAETPKLSAVFRLEYVNYLKYKKQQKELELEAEQEDKAGEKPEKAKKERSPSTFFGGYKVGAADYSYDVMPISEDMGATEEYENPDDARAVRAEIKIIKSGIVRRAALLVMMLVFLVAIHLVVTYYPRERLDQIPYVSIWYCLINTVVMGLAAWVSLTTLKSGLRPLVRFSGNSDTAVSIAVIAGILQSLSSFFFADSFYGGYTHLYTLVIVFALAVNNIGKWLIMKRIKNNFRFVTAPGRKYAVKTYDHHDTSKKMTEETINEGEPPVIAFQRRTDFLRKFLTLSYAADPSEKVSSRIAPITSILSVAIAVIYGFVHRDPLGAFTALAAVASIGVPLGMLLSVNIPITRLCKKSLRNDAMVAGYPSIQKFSKTNSVMLDSRDIYPRGNIEVIKIKTFNAYNHNIEKNLISAAAVMKAANNSLTYIFEGIIAEKADLLPNVESLKFEDSKGLVSWVGGERILVGTRNLMTKYGVELPSVEFERKNRIDNSNQVTYIANSTTLIAMIVTYYQPNEQARILLQRMAREGVAFLVRTSDSNITKEKIAEDYGISVKCIKLLPTSLGNICKEQISIRDESSTAYVSTKGKVNSMLRAILGCIRVKSNISIAIAIQLFSVVLGLLITCIVVLVAGAGSFSPENMILYMILWAVAAIFAPLLQKL